MDQATILSAIDEWVTRCPYIDERENVRNWAFNALDKDEAKAAWTTLDQARAFTWEIGKRAYWAHEALSSRVGFGFNNSHPVTNQKLTRRYGGR